MLWTALRMHEQGYQEPLLHVQWICHLLLFERQSYVQPGQFGVHLVRNHQGI